MPQGLRDFPWLLLEGGVLLLLGAVALCAPLGAGIAAVTVLGWVLLASGSLGLIVTFFGDSPTHRGWSLGSACAALALGAVLVIFPLVGTEAIVLLVGAYLLVDGVITVGMALDHRKKATHWGWLMFIGVADVVLACVLVLLTTLASATLVGVVIGVDLIMAGAALMALQWAASRPHGRARPAATGAGDQATRLG